MRKLLSATAMILAVAMTLPASAADLAPVQVFTDGTQDNSTAPEATFPGADLVAGFIGETDETIDFTWQVADLPDETDLPPEGLVYFWEFQLAPEGDVEPANFSLRVKWSPVEAEVSVRPDPSQPPAVSRSIRSATLGTDQCTSAVVTRLCGTVHGAQIAITSDGVANTITAKVRRTDLRNPTGEIVAVDGAELSEVELFRGIGAFIGTVAVTLAATGDFADMDDVYVLGSPRPEPEA